MRRFAWLALAGAVALPACGDDAAPPEAPASRAVATGAARAGEGPAADDGATPLAERVATLGVLNKRNNVSRDITLHPGESREVGDVLVRLASCERTAPWESPEETGAFVQVLVRQPNTADSYAKVFSGWLFENSPSVNVVEHPIYDVWVKDCAMRFPGEGPAPSPSPSASPSPPADSDNSAA